MRYEQRADSVKDTVNLAGDCATLHPIVRDAKTMADAEIKAGSQPTYINIKCKLLKIYGAEAFDAQKGAFGWGDRELEIL